MSQSDPVCSSVFGVSLNLSFKSHSLMIWFYPLIDISTFLLSYSRDSDFFLCVPSCVSLRWGVPTQVWRNLSYTYSEGHYSVFKRPKPRVRWTPTTSQPHSATREPHSATRVPDVRRTSQTHPPDTFPPMSRSPVPTHQWFPDVRDVCSDLVSTGIYVRGDFLSLRRRSFAVLCHETSVMSQGRRGRWLFRIVTPVRLIDYNSSELESETHSFFTKLRSGNSVSSIIPHINLNLSLLDCQPCWGLGSRVKSVPVKQNNTIKYLFSYPRVKRTSQVRDGTLTSWVIF